MPLIWFSNRILEPDVVYGRIQKIAPPFGLGGGPHNSAPPDNLSDLAVQRLNKLVALILTGSSLLWVPWTRGNCLVRGVFPSQTKGGRVGTCCHMKEPRHAEELASVKVESEIKNFLVRFKKFLLPLPKGAS